ncbi:MAG: hypothetical protein ABIM19_00595, partial [candidate division WOR-3 bacterium]
HNSPWVKGYLLMLLGVNYGNMGELGKSVNCFQQALGIAEFLLDRDTALQAKVYLAASHIFNSEYRVAYRLLSSILKDLHKSSPLFYTCYYYFGICALATGNLEKVAKAYEVYLESQKDNIRRAYFLEIMAFVLRIRGKLAEAMETFVNSAKEHVEHGSAYSVYPIAKALELSRLAGFEPVPRELLKKALDLARRGGLGEQAAAEEIDALLKDDDSEAAEMLYDAANDYLRAHQNIEALFSGLTAACLAWKTDSPVFTKALKLIASLIPLHPGLRKDPLLGDFMSEVEPFLRKALRHGQDKDGIKAYLIGELRVMVDGKEVNLRGWRNNKAIKGLIYLLLSSKHRIPSDHLFYLLWPRRALNERTRYYLYNAIAAIRRNLGRPELLVKKRDFYQLEGDVWTDLGELENLIRLADATRDPAEREEYLAKSKELARGDLLPEFPYDKHIEEYRYYYERIRQRLGLR